MKKLCVSLAAILFLTSLPHAEEPTLPGQFFSDGGYLLTSPLRLDSSNYKTPLIVCGAIGATALLDRTIRDHLFNWRNSDPSEDLRHLGDYGQIAGPVIGTFFGIEGAINNDAKSKETAWLSYESFIWAGAISGALKFVIGRERPEKTDNPFVFKFASGDSSFPSGHTTEAFAAATVFSEQYPKWYVVGPSYAAATAIGFSRMYANKHWFSDVVAGAALGISVSHVLRKRHRRPGQNLWTFDISPNGVQLARKF